MATTKTTPEQLEARARLLELLTPGTIVYTHTEHVSRSGMYRAITPYVMTTVGTGDAFPMDLSWLIERAGFGRKLDTRHGGLQSHGCGMDMGFHLVYSLSRALYPHGAPCTGHRYTEKRRNGRVVKGCHSNDHSNGDRDFRRGKLHTDGGYALVQSWM